jgi:hypothetical protein
MHFSDLSPYAYNSRTPLLGVLNVGWLERGHEFSTGELPAGLLAGLRRWLRQSRCVQYRGYHLCDLCEPAPTTIEEVSAAHRRQETVDDEGTKLILGANEIWVPTSGERIFAAPSLVVHYVERHAYLPPQAFIDAVMAPTPADWDAEKISQRRMTASR